MKLERISTALSNIKIGFFSLFEHKANVVTSRVVFLSNSDLLQATSCVLRL